MPPPRQRILPSETGKEKKKGRWSLLPPLGIIASTDRNTT